jgi:prepilin-type N-terminal cleavage/methylation domain-containing protein
MPRSARSAPTEPRGFALVEVILAIVLLTVGVMALVGSSAMATRMIGRGGRATEVAHVAGSRAEVLRRVAAGTTPRCGGLADGTAGWPGGVVERWMVLGAAGDPARDVRLTLDYRVPGGNRTDTFTLSLDCR